MAKLPGSEAVAVEIPDQDAREEQSHDDQAPEQQPLRGNQGSLLSIVAISETGEWRGSTPCSRPVSGGELRDQPPQNHDDYDNDPQHQFNTMKPALVDLH
jgi:hypothetical protein